jgi:hypothetical protein
MDKFLTVEERQNLYNEIWKEPVATVAKRYSISDTALRKRCNKLNIPLPPRGYWEKIKSGQRIKKPALSKVFGKYVGIVHNSIIKYKYSANELTDEKLLILKNEELSLLTDETKMFINKKCVDLMVKNQLRNPHQLILNHQEEMKFRKQKEKELREDKFLLKRFPYREIMYTNFNSSLPIHVSDKNIKRVYRILNSLFKTLEKLDANISVQPYLGKDVANIRVGRHFYEFEAKEDYNKSSKKKKNDKDSIEEVGVLVLLFSVKSSYGKDLNKILEYRDSEMEPFEAQLAKIILDLFVTSNQLDVLEEISGRAIERRWEEEKRQQHLEELKKIELERISKLESMVFDWDKAKKIREFAESLDENILKTANENERQKITSWIKWVRNKADWIDPLISREDEILGKKYDIHEISEQGRRGEELTPYNYNK